MNEIISALNAIKTLFPQVTILNNKDKNGNKCIVLLNIENCWTEQQLQSISEYKDLYTAVDAYDDESVGISYTNPSESSKNDGRGLIFIGQSSVEDIDTSMITL
jgi:hypothetical protein